MASDNPGLAVPADGASVARPSIDTASAALERMKTLLPSLAVRPKTIAVLANSMFCEDSQPVEDILTQLREAFP